MKKLDPDEIKIRENGWQGWCWWRWLVWQQWWCQKDLSHQRCYFPHLVRKFYRIHFGLIGNKMDIKGDIDGGQEWPKDANIEAPRVLKGVIHPHFLPPKNTFLRGKNENNLFFKILVQPSVWTHGGMIDRWLTRRVSNNETATRVIDFNISNCFNKNA